MIKNIYKPLQFAAIGMYLKSLLINAIIYGCNYLNFKTISYKKKITTSLNSYNKTLFDKNFIAYLLIINFCPYYF